MIIAFTTKESGENAGIDPRFGRCAYFVLFNDEDGSWRTIDNRDASLEAHGAGPKAARRLAKFNPDVLITGNGPGGNAAALLQQMNLKIFTGAEGSAAEALAAWKEGRLTEA